MLRPAFAAELRRAVFTFSFIVAKSGVLVRASPKGYAGQ